MRLAIKNARIVTADEVIKGGVCLCEDGKIIYVGKGEAPADKVLDAKGCYLVPGFVDLHCHGGNCLEFMDADAKGFSDIASFHLSHGTTTMLATTLAANDEETIHALDTFKEYRAINPCGTLLGAASLGKAYFVFITVTHIDSNVIFTVLIVK